MAGSIIFSDDFQRSTGPTTPWNVNDWGSLWEILYVSSSGTTWVDGSAARVQAAKYATARVKNAESTYRMRSGYVQWDFYVPANISDTRPYWWTTQGKNFTVQIAVEQQTGSTWRAWVGNYDSWTTRAIHTFTPQASTWYTIKGSFNGVAFGALGIKIWKRGDAEPGSNNATGTNGTIELTPAQWVTDKVEISVYGCTAETGAMDNFVYYDADTVPAATVLGTLTANAILRKTMPTATATLDAEIVPRHFFAEAWIIGRRSGHSRFLDHFGTEPDTVVVLDGAIEKYASGTDVHTVLTDIVARITALEGGNHRVRTFTMGAFIQPYFRADAILKKTMLFPGIPGDYDDKRGCIDAVIVASGFKVGGSFSAAAQIIRPVSGSFTCGAYLIDLVC